MEYKKIPISTRDQVLRLKERGLIISDESLAEQYLHNISYYRLRAYTYPFQKNDEGEEHVFYRKISHSKKSLTSIALTGD